MRTFATRLFSVLRFESVIHEFDPYFNYRTTKYLAEHGFYSFHNWFDERAWYPLGRIIGVSRISNDNNKEDELLLKLLKNNINSYTRKC
ncbi:hypothetical protein NQ317_001952 [Molorchus minor]|uniref:Dolichyl-diphosphooligosaccharide--protein glycosyltransferase subunit STT3A n=1 Tax=Molorchus minor TaxID=1323400 RepID=A0ABQ9J9R2_9CUCU|nr:hypothetical protein NQ317_001952 [Molorchus minor]